MRGTYRLYFMQQRCSLPLLAFLLAAFLLQQQAALAQVKIVRIEYYVDNDPGIGIATAISITPAAQLSNLSLSLNPASLSAGLHWVGIRAKDSLGRWSLTNRLLFLKPFPINANTNALPPITYVEGYLDNNSVLGASTNSLGLPSSSNISNAIYPLDPSGLTPGVHQFNFRARDSLGNWSLFQRLLFIKPYAGSSAVSAIPSIAYAEWFIDTDPGFGSGTAVSLTPSTNISNAIIPVNPAGLTQGVHQFNLRAKDSLGNWSLAERLLFIKPYSTTGTSIAAPGIAYAEWFIDNDPGYGSGTSISVSSSLANLVVGVNPASLSSGVHQFNVRTKDSAGNWSLEQRLLFIKAFSSTATTTLPPKINYAEWFIDTDPGRGSATSIPLTAATDINGAIVSVNPSTLTAGVHQFNVRGRDSIGNWSLCQRLLFFKPYPTANATPLANLSRLEYFIDTDPGRGNGTSIAFTPGSNVSNLLVSINKTGYALGPHKLFVRALDSTGNWSLVNKADFTIISPAISIDSFNSTICAGASFSFHYTLNSSFNAANVFTVQLSSASGSFSSPVNIGSKTSNSSDTITALIPATTAAGTQYRIRMISSLPADTSAPSSFPITIKRQPEQNYAISGAVKSCTGNQVYQYSPVDTSVQYTWSVSGAATVSSSSNTATVTWYNAGLSYVRLGTSNLCGSGPTDTLYVQVFSSVPTITPTVTRNYDTLRTASQLASSGVTGYQWYKDSVLIQGATDTVYNTSGLGNGIYMVRYKNPCGSGPYSSPTTILTRLAQSITFPAIPNKTFGDSAFKLTATTTSSLPVVYSILSGPATLHGDTLIIIGAGSITVYASQAGDSTYLPASTVYKSFTVARASQTITFTPVAGKTYGDPAFQLVATASTGLPITFSRVSGNITVSGSSVILTGGGTAVVRATQAGSSNYLSTFSDNSFCVSAKTPDTIRGYKISCISTQPYNVDSVTGFLYQWGVTSGGSFLDSIGGNARITWTATGARTITVNAYTACDTVAKSKSLGVTVLVPQTIGSVTNLYPADSVIVSSYPQPFSWAPATNAIAYDFYVWPDGTSMPAIPTFADQTQIGVALNQGYLVGFTPGKRYFWKVIAKDACSQNSSVTRTFTTANVPDLIVSAIAAPDTVFSGQNIAVDVTIKNIGPVLTTSTWLDGLYLSADTVLDENADLRLGSQTNVAALGFNQTYINAFQAKLPDDVISPSVTVGDYYLIAKAKNYGNQAESTSVNNVYYKKLVINLTPPPDLRVTSVVSPSVVFSGQTLALTYTVKNSGIGNTKVTWWRDYVYISADSVLNTGTAIKLSDLTYNQGILMHDSSYTRATSVTVPIQLFGRYYIHVVTDGMSQVFEHAFENNNTGRNDSLDVYLTPAPDYTISNFNAPLTASKGETVSVDWTVTNDGAARLAKDSVWQDAVYASSDSILNTFSDALLTNVLPPNVLHPACSINALGSGGCRYIKPLMAPNESYYLSANVTLPQNLNDSLFLFVKTDRLDNIYEHNYEGNNTARIKVKLRNPDLSPTAIQVPATVTAGANVLVSFTVKNLGPGKLLNRYRYDKISISPTSTYSATTAIQLGTIYSYTNLDSGNSTSSQLTVKIPDSLSGTYYVFVENDYNSQIIEVSETNNRLASAAITVTMPPSPDLQLTQVIRSKDTLVSDASYGISYTVKNFGLGAVQGKTWVDNIYLSKLAIWNSDSAKLIKSVSRTQTLASDSNYTVSDSVLVSMTLMQSMKANGVKAYFFVRTDSANAVYEGNNENNNIGRSDSVFSKHAEHADLTVTSVSVPAALQAGNAGQVSYTIKNLGGPTGYYYGYWYDGLFLSQDTFWNAGDVFLTDAAASGVIAKDSSYNGSFQFTTPNGTSGNYYLLLVADHKNYNKDKDTSNNYMILRGPTGTATTTTITMAPPSDLQVDSFSSPAIGYSGQPVRIKWQIANHGTGPTNKKAWTERFYLSLDTIPSTSDWILASYARTDSLAASALYEDSMDVFLPISAQGNYYILLKTDDNNAVYEHNAEGNNTAARLLFVIQPAPSDLVAGDVAIDSTVIVGDSATVTWVTQNSGANAASGFMREGVYLSSDTLFSNDDVLMANPSFNVLLAPADTLHHQQRFKVKGVSPGAYYAIVRADLLNNIPESDEANNVTASSAPVSVSVLQLPLDTTKYNVLKNSSELYYRLHIPDSLDGETILLSLKGDSLHAANELYVRYDTLAARTKYDISFTRPLSANQDILIPAARKGDHYILAYGATSLTSQQQSISLHAKKINFSILSVDANEGGNTGLVTIRIDGAKFQPGMKARLYNSSFGTVTATTVYYLNSTTVYATFNLAGRSTGLYGVRLVKPAFDSTSLAAAFTIQAGAGSVEGGNATAGGFYCNITNTGVNELLGLEVLHPLSVRDNRVFPMTIIYGNSGNVDIPVPTRILITERGDPVALDPAAIIDDQRELLLEFSERNGPPGILRPGATGSIIIFTKSIQRRHLKFRLIE